MVKKVLIADPLATTFVTPLWNQAAMLDAMEA
jgi:hypothetical protein